MNTSWEQYVVLLQETARRPGEEHPPPAPEERLNIEYSTERPTSPFLNESAAEAILAQNPVVLPPTSSSYPERVAMAPVASQLPPIDVFSQTSGPVTTQIAPPVNVPPLEPLPSFSGRGAARLIAAAATALATPAELPGMLDLATTFAPPPEPSAEEVQNRVPVLNLHREIRRTQPAPTASRSSSSLALSDETQASLLQDIDPEVIAAITEGPEDTPSRVSSASRISEALATADLSGLPELPDLPEVPEHEEEPKAGPSQEREEGEVTDTDDGKEKVIWSEQSTEVWSDEEGETKTPATVVKKKSARDELDPRGDSEEPVDAVSVSTASPLSRPPSPAVWTAQAQKGESRP